MPIIRITAEAHKAITGATGQESDGSHMIRLERETLMRLREVELPGETISDTIIRLAKYR